MKSVNLAAASAILALGAWAHAGVLYNDGFETYASGSGFNGWNNYPSGTVPAIAAPVAISGNYSARLQKNVGYIYQGASPGWTNYTLDLDFASLDPLAGTANRSLHLVLPGGSGSNAPKINLRVVEGTIAGYGTIEAYNGSSFVPILRNVIAFSSDLNTLVVNHLTVVVNFTGSTPGYRVQANVRGQDANWTDLETLYQNSTPTQTVNVEFHSESSTADYVVDNVILTPIAVPEAATVTILSGGAAGLLARRRRRY